MSPNIEALYPFLILIGVAVVKGLQKKAQGKKAQEEMVRRPPTRTPKPRKPVPPVKRELKPLKPRSPSVSTKTRPASYRKRPRIAKVIGGLKSKKELILLSEILLRKED